MSDESLVWYAAYGSNLRAARLGCYLRGGTPAGALRRYPGCRDRTPPRATAAVMLPGRIYFALESAVWTGGMAFYDPDLPGWAAARAYLISAGQFADIAAQEMYRAPGVDLALDHAGAPGRYAMGAGRYETVVVTGSRADHPVLTLTAPWPAGRAPLNPPSPTYLGMLAGGLSEAHGWDAERIVGYLAVAPGIQGRWSDEDLRAAVGRGIRAARPGGPG